MPARTTITLMCGHTYTHGDIPATHGDIPAEAEPAVKCRALCSPSL